MVEERMTITQIPVNKFNNAMERYTDELVYVEDSQQEGSVGYGIIDSYDVITARVDFGQFKRGDLIDFNGAIFQSQLEIYKQRFTPPQACVENNSCLKGVDHVYTHKDVYANGSFCFDVPDRLSANQIKEDIDFIIYILQTAYVGNCAQQKEMNALYKKLLRLKKHSTAMTTKSFYNKLTRILSKLPDQHISINYPLPQQNFVEKIGNQDLEPIGSNQFQGEEWQVKEEKHIVNNQEVTLIEIVIDRMVVEDDPSFAPAMKEAVGKSDALIIDLRGNGGGSEVPVSLIKLLTNLEITPTLTWRRKTAEAYAIRANQFEYLNQTGDFIPQEHVEDRIKSYFRAVNNELPEWSSNRESWKGERDEPFGKPIYVLINEGCYSSTEETVAILKQIPEVILIGSHTGGAFHFGGCGRAFLPNSNLNLYCGTRYVELIDSLEENSFIEGTGFEPDIVSGKWGYKAKTVAIEKMREYFKSKRD